MKVLVRLVECDGDGFVRVKEARENVVTDPDGRLRVFVTDTVFGDMRLAVLWNEAVWVGTAEGLREARCVAEDERRAVRDAE